MAMSMLRSSTAVSVTNTSESIHAATWLVESFAHSKKSSEVKAPSRSLTSVEKMSAPPSSSAHPPVSSSTLQLKVKATSMKTSSTRKESRSPRSMLKNISTKGPNRGETRSTRIRRNQSRSTAAARSDVAVSSALYILWVVWLVWLDSNGTRALSSAVDTVARSAASEKISAVVSRRLILSSQ
eukprot:scaffold96007_cov30-Phaeocystis_antarctica.AAC.2